LRKVLVLNEKKNNFFFILCGTKTLEKSFSTFFSAETTEAQGLREIFFVQKTLKIRNLLTTKGLQAAGQDALLNP